MSSMTKQEAIEILTEMRDWNDYINQSDALQMAIDELEKKPAANSEDAISRQAAIDATTKYCVLYDLRELLADIEALPSINVTEKTGRWITQDIHNCHTDFKCSECGYIHSFMHLYCEPTADYTYCPYCGAKMEVEE